jgi:hypothetical protein
VSNFGDQSISPLFFRFTSTVLDVAIGNRRIEEEDSEDGPIDILASDGDSPSESGKWIPG